MQRQWRKSSYSGNEGNCVEVRDLDGSIGIRDSKNPEGPVLTVSPDRWTAFVAAIKDGRAR
jgi:hypothetical protein